MSFRLQSLVNIGSYQLKGGINHANIKRSVKEIVDTAVLKIPAVGRIMNSDTQPESSIATSKLWQEGDPVIIALGYNDDLRNEFQGFVRRVTPAIPVEVECEGYAWQLRRKRLLKSFKSVSLKEFLKELIAGTDIVLSPYIPDMQLSKLTINHANGLKTLEYLKDKLHLSVYFQFNVLYVGLEEGVPGNTVQFRLGWNVKRDDNLKYRKAEDNKVLVRLVTGKGKKAKRTLIEVGDPDGSLIERNVANIVDTRTLQKIANDLLQKAKYTGYEGHLNGFLQPFCQPCDTAQVIDKKYNIMDDSNFVEGIEVEFGMEGGIRKTHIGRSLKGK